MIVPVLPTKVVFVLSLAFLYVALIFHFIRFLIPTMTSMQLDRTELKEFGIANDTNTNWNQLKVDFIDWETKSLDALFIHPREFQKLYPRYNFFTYSSFRQAYVLLLEEKCKSFFLLTLLNLADELSNK